MGVRAAPARQRCPALPPPPPGLRKLPKHRACVNWCPAPTGARGQGVRGDRIFPVLGSHRRPPTSSGASSWTGFLRRLRLGGHPGAGRSPRAGGEGRSGSWAGRAGPSPGGGACWPLLWGGGWGWQGPAGPSPEGGRGLGGKDGGAGAGSRDVPFLMGHPCSGEDAQFSASSLFGLSGHI